MFNHYPYTDLHELNLDWILRKIKELHSEFDEFKALNTITFAGTWNITEQYPQWTIVDNGGFGYVSLQPVPAGIPLTNTDYWIQVVDYSAIYNDLENRITALEALTAKGFDDSGKWLFLGDSYAASGWVSTVINVLGINDRAYDESVSGHAFNDGTWLGDFSTFIAGRTDLDEFKHVVIGGGLNDATPASLTGTVLADAITAFCTAVHTYMPNAKIEVAYIGNALNDSLVLYGRTAANIAQAIAIYRNMLPNNKACYLNNTEYIMHNYSLFAADHLHPNTSGGYRIAMGIIEALMTGSCNVIYWYEDATQQTVGNFTIYNGYRCIVNNGLTKLILNNILHTNRTLTNHLTNTAWDLGQLPSGCLQYVAPQKDFTAQVSTNNATTKILCLAKIVDRHLIIACEELNGYGGYLDTDLTGKRVDLGTLEFTFSTLEDSQEQ